MDMPDKIWVGKDGWAEFKDCGFDIAQYTRTDLAQSLADALEGILDSVAECESGDVCQKSDFSDARAALANYRKGE